MHTHYQKALSVVLFTSMLLQSCGGNLMLGEHRPAMREESNQSTYQEPSAGAQPALGAPESRQAEERQREGSFTATASRVTAPSTLQSQPKRPSTPSRTLYRMAPPPYTPRKAWEAQQQRALHSRGLPLPESSLGLLGGMMGAGEEKQDGPPPTEDTLELEDDEKKEDALQQHWKHERLSEGQIQDYLAQHMSPEENMLFPISLYWRLC